MDFALSSKPNQGWESKPLTTLTVLSARWEYLNIGLGLVFVIISVLCVILNFVPSSAQFLSLRLVSYLLFLNLIHIGFTYALLLKLPETRAVGGYKNGSVKNWLLWLVVTSVVCLALVYNEFPQIASNFGLPKFSPRAFYFLWLTYSGFHVLAQVNGFLSQYNYRMKSAVKSDRQMQMRFDQMVRRERVLLRWFTGMALTPLVLHACFAMGILDPRILAWISIFNIASAIFFVLIALNILTMGWRLAIPKLLFSLRIGLFCLAPLNILVGPMIQALHGLEYGLFVNKLIRGKERAGSNDSGSFWIVAWSLGLISAMLVLSGPVNRLEILLGFSPLPVFLGSVLFVVGKTLQFGHFYIDGFLFRFSDSRISESLGPLLVVNENQTSS